MEANRSFQHLCKLCNKSFRCGRSLGGHMRSHLMNRLELRGLNNGGNDSNKMKIMEPATCSGYGLRENPKRTAIKMEEQESWSFMDQKMINDSKSDRKFSAPTRKRQLKTVASSALEIDQEQEEIALCLIMLSRDSRLQFCEFQSDHDNRFEIMKLGKNSHNQDSKTRSKHKKTSKTHHPDFKNYKISQKRSEFECSSCKKVFRSYQALGGHKASHGKMKSCFDSTMEVAKNSIEAENEDQIDTETRDFIDLNLPASADEESNYNNINNLELDPWWVKSFYQTEKLLSFVEELNSKRFSFSGGFAR